ncbi:XdhC family protein [Paracoccus sp. 11-3]|uniref:XdhC family protein n=1 Tax=Paracoccus amoyensis TaxID=2760093 RepID=A0A926GHY3_9RHOB|nr:XdhC family protein [Paracoccus amoyensis]MBC9247604.1 XdhC family protein [Paracoccus amoyensis]
MARLEPDIARAGGNSRVVSICESEVPLACALAGGRVALAVITGVEGASYRPVGAVMVVDEQGQSWGSLSSGCIERDVIRHAGQALADGQNRNLRYGSGSPFRDLALPCGGGLDIQIVTNPDMDALTLTRQRLDQRHAAVLKLGPLTLNIQPQPRFLVFGKGPEARCFAALTAAAGYPVHMFSPDPKTLQGFENATGLMGPKWPGDVQVDPRTAVALFFHDHDWEPPLLKAALESPAFFIGAQGSLRAHNARCDALATLGVAPPDIGRLASPFGLIPSARDPRTLAASVLAQVLERARLQ